MTRKLAFIGMMPMFLVLVACGTKDPAGHVVLENTVALCTDGIDNDGDGNFDCYDANCRALDSTMRLHGDTLCHYENYHPIFAILPSSNATSSSTTTSSSSAQTVTNSGFPINVVNTSYDSIQVLSLARKPGSVDVMLSGRLDNQALYGTIDTLGELVQSPIAYKFGTSSSSLYHFNGLDTNTTGDFLFYGSTNGAATYYWSSSTGATSSFQASFDEFVFVGATGASTACFVANTADTGFVTVDLDLTSKTMPYPPYSVINGRMVAGALDTNSCVAVGQHNSGDSTQIWFQKLSATDSAIVQKQITTGSKSEKVFDLAIANGKYYLASTVDGAPSVLVLNASFTLVSSTGENLGGGSPVRIRPIVIGGVPRLLMVGVSGSSGALWVLDANGNKLSEYLDLSVSAFTDVVQLESGNLIVAGYVSSSKGTNGVIKKFTTSLTEIK